METLDALQVYDEFYLRILRYVLSRVGDVEVARDITAEVFLKMVKSRWKFRLTKAPVSAWLFRIAGNEISSYYRKEKYRPLGLDAALAGAGTVPLSLRGDLQQELSEAQEKIDRSDAYLKVQRHLRMLPDKYQEVIVLHYLEAQSVPQIAMLLGKKEGTVKSLISRGIAKLSEATGRECRMLSGEGFLIDESPQNGVNV
jgi:RNA polymerase sigma-70 factor (ECF subfamily)